MNIAVPLINGASSGAATAHPGQIVGAHPPRPDRSWTARSRTPRPHRGHPGQIVYDLRTLCQILGVAIARITGAPLINSSGVHPGQIVGAHPGHIVDPQIGFAVTFDWWSISNPVMSELDAYAIAESGGFRPVSRIRPAADGYQTTIEYGHEGDREEIFQIQSHHRYENGNVPGVRFLVKGGKSNVISKLRSTDIMIGAKLSRADVAIDISGEGLYKKLRDLVLDFEFDDLKKSVEYVDHNTGAGTISLGSKSAEWQLVVYEKGKQLGTDEGWVRVEWRYRPKSKHKVAAAKLSASEVIRTCRWSCEFIKQLSKLINGDKTMKINQVPIEALEAKPRTIEEVGRIGARQWARTFGERDVRSWQLGDPRSADVGTMRSKEDFIRASVRGFETSLREILEDRIDDQTGDLVVNNKYKGYIKDLEFIRDDHSPRELAFLAHEIREKAIAESKNRKLMTELLLTTAAEQAALPRAKAGHRLRMATSPLAVHARMKAQHARRVLGSS